MLIFSFLFTISTTAFGTGSAFPISTQPTPANGTSLRARDGTSGWRKTGDVGPKHLMSRGPRGHHQTSGGWSKRTNDDRIAKDAAMVAILDDFYGRSAVITEVSIGQPPQKIKMLVDTGSGVLLTSMRGIQGVPCLEGDSQCALVSRFDRQRSVTLDPKPNKGQTLFKAQFEDSSVLCMLGSDTMQLLGLHTDDFPFGMVASTRVGGILGLSLKSTVTYVDALKESPLEMIFGSDVVNDRVFTLSFPPGQPGQLLFGEIPDVDPASPIEWHDVYPENTDHWSVQITSLAISGSSYNVQSMHAVVDSGTELTFLPKSVAAALYNHIPGSTLQADGITYMIPCNVPINGVSITLEGTSYPISDEDLKIRTNQSKESCLSSIGQHEHDLVLLGTRFMKGKHVVFDYENMKVGFGSM